MYCPNCGKEVMDTDVFCMNCGYRLQAAEEKSEEKPAKAPVETENKDAVAEDLLEETVVLEAGDPFESGEEALKVPVKDVHGDGPSKICRMCGCKIPADSVYCPVCQQQTGDSPRSQQATREYYYVPQQTQEARKPKNKLNVLALVGFILSMASMFVGEYLGVGLSIAGLVLGCVGLKKSKETGQGKGFAVAAIVVGAVGIALNVLLVVLDLTGVIAGLESWMYEFWGSTEDVEVIFPFGGSNGYSQ